MAGSMIQSTKIVEFEDGLRVGVLPGCGWCNCGDCIKPRINSNTILGMGGGPRGGVIVNCKTKYSNLLGSAL